MSFLGTRLMDCCSSRDSCTFDVPHDFGPVLNALMPLLIENLALRTVHFVVKPESTSVDYETLRKVICTLKQTKPGLQVIVQASIMDTARDIFEDTQPIHLATGPTINPTNIMVSISDKTDWKELASLFAHISTLTVKHLQISYGKDSEAIPHWVIVKLLMATGVTELKISGTPERELTPEEISHFGKQEDHLATWRPSLQIRATHIPVQLIKTLSTFYDVILKVTLNTREDPKELCDKLLECRVKLHLDARVLSTSEWILKCPEHIYGLNKLSHSQVPLVPWEKMENLQSVHLNSRMSKDKFEEIIRLPTLKRVRVSWLNGQNKSEDWMNLEDLISVAFHAGGTFEEFRLGFELMHPRDKPLPDSKIFIMICEALATNQVINRVKVKLITDVRLDNNECMTAFLKLLTRNHVLQQFFVGVVFTEGRRLGNLLDVLSKSSIECLSISATPPSNSLLEITRILCTNRRKAVILRRLTACYIINASMRDSEMREIFDRNILGVILGFV